MSSTTARIKQIRILLPQFEGTCKQVHGEDNVSGTVIVVTAVNFATITIVFAVAGWTNASAPVPPL